MASSRSAMFRKAGLLILLLAAAIVVAFQYIPREEPPGMAAPTKKPAPTPQVPLPGSSPQKQGPAGEQPSPQPDKSPGIPIPPLDYEKPPATVFVSSSPSDSIPASATAAADLKPAADGKPVSGVSGLAQERAGLPPRPMPEGPIPGKVGRAVRHFLAKYDANGDGSLDAREWKQMAGAPEKIDYDADGVITAEELAAYWADYGRNRRMRLTGSIVEAVAETPLWIPTAEHEARAVAEQAAKAAETVAEQAAKAAETAAATAAETAAATAAESDSVLPVALPDGAEEAILTEPDAAAAKQAAEPAPAPKSASRPDARRFAVPKTRLAGLPDWFLAKDANGDGQLTMAEYAPSGSEPRLAEFNRLDRNRDGVLTPEECRR